MGGNKTTLEFGDLLDELLAASTHNAQNDDETASPVLRVDLLAQIERLQKRDRPLFATHAIDAYQMNAEEAPASRRPTKAPLVPDLEPALDDLFFLDPATISGELDLAGKSSPEELDRARRSFAKRYHPDRMPEHMRERAMLRMQIANMLIDEAKRNRQP